jgi:hypothetical protein
MEGDWVKNRFFSLGPGPVWSMPNACHWHDAPWLVRSWGLTTRRLSVR